MPFVENFISELKNKNQFGKTGLENINDFLQN